MFARLISRSSQFCVLRSQFPATSRTFITSSSRSKTCLPFNVVSYRSPYFRLRSFCKPAGQKPTSSSSKAAVEAEASGAAGEKYALQGVKVVQGVKNASWGGLILCVTGLVSVCGYVIIRELMPSSMGPNSVFNKAYERVKNNPELIKHIGTGIKGYGMDVGGRREGRRNAINHIKMTDDDGIKHTRIRFNLEGSRGKAICYADVSEAMGKDDFYYLIIEVPQSRRKSFTFAVIDNRPKIPLSVRQGEVAKNLTLKCGAKLYGTLSDPHTAHQLKEFGQAVNQITFIDCNEKPQECQAAGIMQIPTWSIKGRLVVGSRKLEDLDSEAKKILN